MNKSSKRDGDTVNRSSEIIVPILANKWTWFVSMVGVMAVALAWPHACSWICVAAANLLGLIEGRSRERAEKAVRERQEVDARALVTAIEEPEVKK